MNVSANTGGRSKPSAQCIMNTENKNTSKNKTNHQMRADRRKGKIVKEETKENN